MFELAQTVWPRFGGDQANRSLILTSGPHVMPTWKTVLLSPSLVKPPEEDVFGGVVVMADGTLRVCYANVLTAVTVGGDIVWQRDLKPYLSNGKYSRVTSLPTALRSGETLVLLSDALLLVDARGRVEKIEYALADPDGEEDEGVPSIYPSDKVFPLNVTYSGVPILPTTTGEVYVFRGKQWHELGVFGYDITSPAVYDDNSLAIAGYYGKGFCRADLNGEIMWSTSFREADLVPTLNFQQVAAVGSLNDGVSAFFSEGGEQIGEYAYAARFAVHPDGGWMALTKQRIARLTLDGKEMWGHDIAPKNDHSFCEQLIVDRDGFTYVRLEESILCLGPDGRGAFEVKVVYGGPELVSIIAPGVMAYTQENRLFIGCV